MSSLKTAFLAQDELLKSGSGHLPQNVALGDQRNRACRAPDGTLPQTTVPVSAFRLPEFMSINVNIMSLERSE